mgnify:CR=1 FL=1
MGIASAEVRQRAINAYMEGEGTQALVAKLYGVDLSTFQRWLQRYRKSGRASPLPRGHNPPALNEGVHIFNQMAESYRLIDLAKMIAKRTGCQISHVPNPRNEADENELIVKNDKFKGLGWEPSSLADGLLTEVEEITKRYSSRCDISKIPCESTWTAKQSAGRPELKVDAAE